MKSTVDKLDGLARKINVQIPVETVQKSFDRVYKAIQKKANIKGFRQGKAPLTTIKSMYGTTVRQDVLNDLVQEAFSQAVDEHNLDPVGEPTLSFASMEALNEDQPFSFSAEFEIRPDVQVSKFEGLSVLKERVEIGDDRVQSVLDNIRESKAETVTLFEDRALVDGDVAVVDFVGHVGDEVLPGGSATGHELHIGTKQFIEGFEEGLLGMKIGDARTLNLRFPEGYHETSLSGAPVRFEVKLTGIKKKVLPELTDEFAKSFGEFESLEALKTRIRDDLVAREAKRINEDLRNRIIRVFVEANPMEVPKTLVERQRQVMEQDMAERLKQQGYTDEQFAEYKQKWSKDFDQSASFMVRSTFLLDALAQKLNMKATDDDINNRIQDYAKETGLPLQKIEDFYRGNDARSRLRFQITEEKVVSHLVEKAKVTEVNREQLAD